MPHAPTSTRKTAMLWMASRLVSIWPAMLCGHPVRRLARGSQQCPRGNPCVARWQVTVACVLGLLKQLGRVDSAAETKLLMHLKPNEIGCGIWSTYAPIHSMLSLVGTRTPCTLYILMIPLAADQQMLDHPSLLQPIRWHNVISEQE